MVTYVTNQGQDTEIAKNNSDTDMTIHWKALEEQFLVVPFAIRFNHLRPKNAFSESLTLKKPVLKKS
jgi:hypothetical protein